MTPPSWAATLVLKAGAAAYKWLDRTLAIRITVDVEHTEGVNEPDVFSYLVRVFNGTEHEERIRLLQLTFNNGGGPMDLAAAKDATVDRIHSYQIEIEDWEVSEHEQNQVHVLHHPVFFNGVRVQFHSGRDVWRPARGFRPVSRWFLMRRRLQKALNQK